MLISSYLSHKLHPLKMEVKFTFFGATWNMCEEEVFPKLNEVGVSTGQKTHKCPIENFMHLFTQQIFLSTYQTLLQ